MRVERETAGHEWSILGTERTSEKVNDRAGTRWRSSYKTWAFCFVLEADIKEAQSSTSGFNRVLYSSLKLIPLSRFWVLVTKMSRDWRDGTTAKNAGCPSGGPVWEFQHPHGASHLSVTLALGDSRPASGIHGAHTWCASVHAGQTSTHVKWKQINLKSKLLFHVKEGTRLTIEKSKILDRAST